MDVMGKGPDTNTGTTGLRRVTDLSLEIMGKARGKKARFSPE